MYYPYFLNNGKVVCETNSLDIEMTVGCNFSSWQGYTGYTGVNGACVCYGNNVWILAKYVNLPNLPQIYSNPDVTNPDTWSLRFNSSFPFSTYNFTPLSSCYGNSGFIVVGNGGNAINSLGIYSPDGYNWSGTTIISGNTNGINKVFYGNGEYIATDTTSNLYGSLTRIFTSTNTINWTNTFTLTGGTGSFFGGCYANGLYVMVGMDKLYTSSNGSTWTLKSHLYGKTTEAYDVNYGNGIWLVTFAQTTNIYKSVDGITWTSGSTTGITGAGNLIICRFINCRFEAVQSDSKQYYSTDGINWTYESSTGNGFTELNSDGKTLSTTAGGHVNSGGVGYLKQV